MEYQALYRRWRPRGFEDFVGQRHVVTTLSNAIAADRIAHAYLFTGPRGTGKTSAAKIFAKALNCESPRGTEPCDRCSACQRINEGVFLGVQEIDGASNRGIDEIRELREKINFSPAEGKYKIYIIDEVHMLTTEAFNALLKTLEEPPRFVIFILATTEAHKLPLTILSRCQRFDFKRFSVGEIKERLQLVLETEGVAAEERALDLIAKYAEGGMRDALSLLEQCLAHGGEKLTEADVRAILGLINQEVIENIARAIQNRDTGECLRILEAVSLDGKDLCQFGRSLVDYFRDLLLAKIADPGESTAATGLVAVIETIAAASSEVKRSFQSALPLEMALIKLTTAPPGEYNLTTRLQKLEEEIAALKFTGSAPAVGRKAALVPEAERPAAGPNSPPKSAKGSAAPRIAETKSSGFNWEGFLEAIKNKKRTVAALIQEGKPVSFGEGKLVIAFPPHLKFHLENLELPQNKELLENILKVMYGEEIKIACIPLANNNSGAKPVKKEEEPPDLLQEAVAIFGGKIEPITKEDEDK